MRTGKTIFITGGEYPIYTTAKPQGWVPTPSGRGFVYEPTAEQERFNHEHSVPIDVPHGQRAIVLDEYCRKTGLRHNDGSAPAKYLDAGTIVILGLIGGDWHGLVISAHDAGNDLEIDGNDNFRQHATP